MRRLWPDPIEDLDVDSEFEVPADTSFIRLQMISSADGSATAGSTSGGLGGTADRALFTALRGSADVVLVASGTVRAEDYGGSHPSQARRAARLALGKAEVPPIAVVTGSLDLDPTSRLFTDSEVKPLLITSATAAAQRGASLTGLAEVIVAGDESVDLALAVSLLRDRGLRQVQLEGGPSLAGQLIDADLVDELCLTLAPNLVTGSGGRIAHSAAALDPPHPMKLLSVLSDDDSYLFLRYSLRLS